MRSALVAQFRLARISPHALSTPKRPFVREFNILEAEL